MADAQKEGFRKYLEAAGVIDALTKVLVSLYEEPDKPKQAIDYMKACLGGPTPAEYDALLAERECLKRELDDAKQQILDLQTKALHEHVPNKSETALHDDGLVAAAAKYS